jgi:hypothetical protein
MFELCYYRNESLPCYVDQVTLRHHSIEILAIRKVTNVTNSLIVSDSKIIVREICSSDSGGDNSESYDSGGDDSGEIMMMMMVMAMMLMMMIEESL